MNACRHLSAQGVYGREDGGFLGWLLIIYSVTN